MLTKLNNLTKLSPPFRVLHISPMILTLPSSALFCHNVSHIADSQMDYFITNKKSFEVEKHTHTHTQNTSEVSHDLLECFPP